MYINSPHKISKWTHNYSKEIGTKYFGFIEVSIYVLVTSADQECDDLITQFTTHKLGALTFFPGGGGSRVDLAAGSTSRFNETTPFKKRKKSLVFKSQHPPPPRAFAPPKPKQTKVNEL